MPDEEILRAMASEGALGMTLAHSGNGLFGMTMQEGVT